MDRPKQKRAWIDQDIIDGPCCMYDGLPRSQCNQKFRVFPPITKVFELTCWVKILVKSWNRLSHCLFGRLYCTKIQCPNISTTPITAMECRQCLPLSVVQLKGKHCQKPHCCNGVVDTFGQGNICKYWSSLFSNGFVVNMYPQIIYLIYNIGVFYEGPKDRPSHQQIGPFDQPNRPFLAWCKLVECRCPI